MTENAEQKQPEAGGRAAAREESVLTKVLEATPQLLA